MASSIWARQAALPRNRSGRKAARNRPAFSSAAASRLRVGGLWVVWECSNPTDRYDIAKQFNLILPDILEEQFDRPLIEPSSYDLWLDNRLGSEGDDTWLSGQSLYAAATFCRLLGVELLRLDTSSEYGNQSGLAHSSGFHVAKRGVPAIREALMKLAELADGYNDTPTKAFGKLFIHLNSKYLRG